MRYLLLLHRSGRRFPEPIIDDLDDMTNAQYHTCEICPQGLKSEDNRQKCLDRMWEQYFLSICARQRAAAITDCHAGGAELIDRKCRIHAMRLVMIQYKSPSMKSLYNHHPLLLAVYIAPFISARA